MSQYTDQLDPTHCICPYCKHRNEPLREVANGSIQECTNCPDSFWVTLESGYVTSPDCELDDRDHDWNNKTSQGKTHAYCTTCDKVLGE